MTSCSPVSRPMARYPAIVAGDKEPGYGSTFELIAEAAIFWHRMSITRRFQTAF